jgi:Predicted membrane protein
MVSKENNKRKRVLMLSDGINLNTFLIYLVIINIFSFGLFALDKYRARTGEWRIEERNLFLAALLGGSIGGLLGMYGLHHKTRHLKFKIGMPLIIVVQILLLFYWLHA